jgi:signal transduction histidine kinase
MCPTPYRSITWLRAILWAWLLLTAMCGLANAQAPNPDNSAPKDHIVASAFWEDASAQASWDTARSQTYTPYQGALSRGYSDSALWIRLTLAPSDRPLLLRILPIWLDEITLYDPANPNTPPTLGQRFPAIKGQAQGLSHAFELQGSTNPRDIWLRMQTTSAKLFAAEAIATDEATFATTRQIVGSVLYVSVLFLFLLVLLPVYWVQREKVLGLFLLKHTAYVYYSAAYLGVPSLLLSQWLPPLFLDKAFTLATVLVVPLSLRFDISLLTQYQPPRRLLQVMRLTPWLSTPIIFALLLGQERLALQMNMYLIVSCVLLYMLAALMARPTAETQQLMPKKVVMGYYIFGLSFLLIGVIGVLGWKPTQAWTMYALIVQGLISGLMMTTMLFVRSHRQLQANLQMSWDLQKAHQDTELEQRRRQEQSQFLHMLMHELKTPLAVVSIALGTRTKREANLDLAGRAIQDMKAIIERCVQADRLGDLALDKHQDTIDLKACISQLGNAIPLLQRRLQLHIDPAITLQTDQQLLQIILSNLLDNAARYSDPVTPVRVSAQATRQGGEDGIALHISNTPGLAGWPDTELIFSKYYRSAGAQKDSGSGLGLFLAQQLANSLGGSLRYQPTQSFVEFVLWLPATPA